MVEKVWAKSVKVALLAGLMGLAGVVEAKEVYYVSGYFGKEGEDKASFTVKDSNGNLTTYEYGDTVVINSQYCTVKEAWVSNELPTDSSFKIRVEMDFTFHSGVSTSVLSGVTMEIAENVTATFSKGKSQYEIQVGTVVFDGGGTIDLSGASSVSDPLTISAGVKFKLPTSYTGSIVITDPENLDMDDYPDYTLSVDENGVATLVKKDQVIAYVEDEAFATLSAAFNAAKPAGTIRLVGWPTALSALTDSSKWRGTVQFTGTMPKGFAPANYGNASSTIEFKGVSGGYFVKEGSFAGTLKVTNDGETAGWTISDGYGTDNFVFGALTGEGDIVAGDSGVKQQYSFKDASTFSGSMTTSSKRLIIGETTHGSASKYTSRIYVEKGHVVRVAKGKCLSGEWGMIIDGTIKGSGTLACPNDNKVIFGFAADTPTIDLAEGAPTIAENCAAYFYQTLILKNAQPGMAVLHVSASPTNMTTVQLKDENGVRSDWMLAYESKNGVVRLLSKNHTPQTLYWNDYRGTFWERLGGSDTNGNHGMLRDENGEECPYIPGDTVIFDQTHYPSNEYWDYNENLYIKSDVKPAEDVNVWDMKILEGVTLKLGFCGASSSGQNLNQNFKIYVDEDSTLELGYWGNTHHREGLLRENVTFGGAGTITLGDDMGSSCRVEDLKVKGDKVPTFDVSGKELVLEGGTIDVNLTNVGTLSGSGTITQKLVVPDGGTLDLRGNIVFAGGIEFEGAADVVVDEIPEDGKIVIAALAKEPEKLPTEVRVVKDGKVVAVFYKAEFEDGKLNAVIDQNKRITFAAEAKAGYDHKTFIVEVTITPALEGVEASVSAANSTWKAMTDLRGIARILVGSPDELLEDGSYEWTATVDGLDGSVSDNYVIAADLIAEVGGIQYSSMRAAVEAAKGSQITLLTNVFFAPPEGEYDISMGAYEIFITNDMNMAFEGGLVKIAAPETIDHYVVMQNDEDEDLPFVVEGDWLGAALPWKTKAEIQTALLSESANGLMPYEAYVLGLGAAEMGTAKLIARGIQTANPDTIEISDGLTPKTAAETGIVVKKKLIEANYPYREVSETTTYELTKLTKKSALLKLSYDIHSDSGQE